MVELGYHSSKSCFLSLVWENKLPENFILHNIFFFRSIVLIFLEGASRSPKNCLTDPKRTADPSLRTTALDQSTRSSIKFAQLIVRQCTTEFELGLDSMQRINSKCTISSIHSLIHVHALEGQNLWKRQKHIQFSNELVKLQIYISWQQQIIAFAFRTDWFGRQTKLIIH